MTEICFIFTEQTKKEIKRLNHEKQLLKERRAERKRRAANASPQSDKEDSKDTSFAEIDGEKSAFLLAKRELTTANEKSKENDENSPLGLPNHSKESMQRIKRKIDMDLSYLLAVDSESNKFSLQQYNELQDDEEVKVLLGFDEKMQPVFE